MPGKNRNKKTTNINGNGGGGNNNLHAPPKLVDGIDGDMLTDSPLRLFGEAKDKINTIYNRLDDCVLKASNFYSDQQLDPEILKNVDSARLKRLNKSIEIIKNVLSRNQMKVAFFGQTSNGKSTAINAILHDNVLPSGPGRITNCFLQIEGTREPEAYLEVTKNGYKDGDHVERSPVQSVLHIANAMKPGVLEHSTLMKIHWPISKCPLLQYDAVLVDSPGIDVEVTLDKWIDEHCHDADVFVLVSDAKSTLNLSEKNFFYKVSEKLSKPSLFVLYNHWDTIAEEPDKTDDVRKQHVDSSVRFLSDELKIVDPQEAMSRTFFVSAREVLQARMSSVTGGTKPKKFGYEERHDEFVLFERRFEECLSKSAVRTKFKKHTDKGKDAIGEFMKVLNNTHELVSKINERKTVELKKCNDNIEHIDKAFFKKHDDLLEHILVIKQRIQKLSSSAFEHEIHRLARVVDDFEEDFTPDLAKLVVYKERLYNHVEEALSENIQNQFHKVVKKHVNPFIENMELISKLLSEQRQAKIAHVLQGKNLCTYDEMFNLRTCRQAYGDFQEDLEFRFSLGLVSIMRKFRRSKPTQPATTNTSTGELDFSHSTQDLRSADGDILAVVERFILNSPQSPTTVGSLAVGGILVRTVGWKVIVATAIVYGALYGYEYLTWTNSAKKNTFKRQFVYHAKSRLRACVPIISDIVASSAEQRLMSCFVEVRHEVKTERESLVNNIGVLQAGIGKLVACEQFTRELLGESDILCQELLAFASSYFS